MVPVKTYRTTDYLYFQCDGSYHFRVERDNGFVEFVGRCDGTKCKKEEAQKQ